MDEQVETTGHYAWVDGERTLADLWPKGSVRAAIVGLNPAPKSVDAGHYYQGNAGQRAMQRLRAAGLIEAPLDGEHQDDAAVRAGVAFTDLVKRPTVGEKDLRQTELEAGRGELLRKLAEKNVPLVVCVFRHPAKVLVDGKAAVGFQMAADGVTRVFRMPGPYAAQSTVDAAMAELEVELRATEPNGAQRALLQAVRLLHAEGFGRLRAYTAMAPSGMSWRCFLRVETEAGGVGRELLRYSSNSGWDFSVDGEAGGPSTARTARSIAEELKLLPGIEEARGPAEEHVGWFDGLLRHIGPVAVPYEDWDRYPGEEPGPRWEGEGAAPRPYPEAPRPR